MSKANPWHSTLSIQPFRIAGTLNQYSGNWGRNTKEKQMLRVVSGFGFSRADHPEGNPLSSAQVPGQVHVTHGGSSGGEGSSLWLGGRMWTWCWCMGRDRLTMVLALHPQLQLPCWRLRRQEGTGNSPGHWFCAGGLCDQSSQGDRGRVWKRACPSPCSQVLRSFGF